MDVWKKFTEDGNEYFSSASWSAAESKYLCAKVQAERQLLSWVDPKEAVAALVISYHNLADLYAKCGKEKKQQQELQAAHCHLLTALQDKSLSCQQFDALLGGVSRSYLALLGHIKAQRFVGDSAQLQ